MVRSWNRFITGDPPDRQNLHLAFVLAAPKGVVCDPVPDSFRKGDSVADSGIHALSQRKPSIMNPLIDLKSDDYFMGEALRQARHAYAADEVPVGAVIIKDGHIIARAYNQVECLKDATAHAEILALTQAQSVVEDWRLQGCTLFVTKEPCPMCAGAIVHCRLDRVVYGLSDPKAGAAGSAMNLLQFPTLNHQCDITQGVQEHACHQLIQSFFREKRGGQA